MSFEAVWGFDPDQVLKAQNMFTKKFVRESGEDQGEADDGAPEARIPGSDDAQLYELRRMFRS